MRVAFMGTPEFAVPSLKALLASRHDIVVVVTGVDKPVGRSLKITESAVKRFARQHDLTVLQPLELNDPFFIRALAGFRPDICLVVAFRILPPDVYNIPQFGSVNLHASLLPELRGAAPINWALMKGLTRTGVTTFQIDRKVDTGNILLQEPVDIEPDDDCGSLADRLSEAGARLAVRTLDELEDGKLKPVIQTGNITNAPRITRDTCRIDWNLPAEKIHNRVRGLSPSPGAFCKLVKKIVKLFRTVPHISAPPGEPGTVQLTDDGRLYVSTGEGSLEILELQIEGKQRMSAAEFLHGRQLQSGTKLG